LSSLLVVMSSLVSSCFLKLHISWFSQVSLLCGMSLPRVVLPLYTMYTLLFLLTPFACAVFCCCLASCVTGVLLCV
jgi:hypothetical protein